MPVLFLSKACKYSRELLNNLNEMGDLTVKLDVVYIEDMKNRIPNFVDRVPLLLLQEEEKILHDEELFAYIKTKEKVIEGFINIEMGHGLSDRYSFTSEVETLDHNFMKLEDGECMIMKSQIITDEGKSLIDYDKFLENRDKDVSEILKKQNHALQNHA
jgi:hypothetical protein